ncbi:MAG: NAD-dependent malic enzyme [Acidimicrobiia bacterium]
MSTTAAYSLRVRVRLENRPGALGELATAVGAVGANIIGLKGFEAKGRYLDEEVIINCRDEAHQAQALDVIRNLRGFELLTWEDRTFKMHDGGKIEVLPLAPVSDAEDLSMAYTPGVARVCMAIHEDVSRSHDLTIRRNTVAIVSNGTAVLGLGDIGPEAAMPVMEGKALLFKSFAGVDAFPICINARTADEIVETVERLAPTFGGVNLEDISAPMCFEVEDRLKASLDIPVFHDDQHGTAVVVLAALENANKLTGRKLADQKVVIAGVGAAGVAIGKILLSAGVGEVIGTDRQGAIWEGRDNLNSAKEWFAKNTNRERVSGPLTDALAGADVFVGVSGPGIVEPSDLRRMAKDPIVFALANPEPEIRPEAADGLARIIATGRSDYPNQINNVLAFPGIFRGALDANAHSITENMKLAAAKAIARAVSEDELDTDKIVPSVFDRDVPVEVGLAVAAAAVADGVIRV